MVTKKSQLTRSLDKNYQHSRSQTRAIWIASIAAIFSLIISVFSLYESHSVRIENNLEKLTVSIRSTEQNELVSFRISKYKNHHGAFITPWEVTLSNIGNNTVSILNWDVEQITVIDTRGNRSTYHCKIDRVLSTSYNQNVKLPLILESGKSIRFRFYIHILPGSKAYGTLAASGVEKKDYIPLYQAQRILIKNSIDLFDNPIIFLRSEDIKATIWSVKPKNNDHIFKFTFETAKGNKITEEKSWYNPSVIAFVDEWP
jgi:hypothetical protein